MKEIIENAIKASINTNLVSLSVHDSKTEHSKGLFYDISLDSIFSQDRHLFIARNIDIRHIYNYLCDNFLVYQVVDNILLGPVLAYSDKHNDDMLLWTNIYNDIGLGFLKNQWDEDEEVAREVIHEMFYYWQLNESYYNITTKEYIKKVVGKYIDLNCLVECQERLDNKKVLTIEFDEEISINVAFDFSYKMILNNRVRKEKTKDVFSSIRQSLIELISAN